VTAGHLPSSDHWHVTEGVCVCEVYVDGHGRVHRTATVHCGVSAHRIEAREHSAALARITAMGD
jgi:hypothetical protein